MNTPRSGRGVLMILRGGASRLGILGTRVEFEKLWQAGRLPIVSPNFRFSGERLIAVDGSGVEGGEADGDVLGSVGRRRAVADPFAAVGDDGLAGVDVDCSIARFDVQRAAE